MRKGGSDEFACAGRTVNGRLQIHSCTTTRFLASLGKSVVMSNTASRIWYWRRATRAGKWAHDVPMGGIVGSKAQEEAGYTSIFERVTALAAAAARVEEA